MSSIPVTNIPGEDVRGCCPSSLRDRPNGCRRLRRPNSHTPVSSIPVTNIPGEDVRGCRPSSLRDRPGGRRRLRRPNSHTPVSSIPVTNTKTKTPPKWRDFCFGVPGENRTHSPRFRKPMLYPVELRGQAKVITARVPRSRAAARATRANRAGRRVPSNQPKRECFWRAECRP